MIRKKKTETSVVREISLSIKEGKWLYVVYDSQKEGRYTYFWCYIEDIEPAKRLLKVSIFNDYKGLDTLKGRTIHLDRIKEAQVLNFTTCGFNRTLVEKINSNIEEYSWLKFDNFDNNILRYLEECNRIDNDPSIHNSAMVEGIDFEVLSEKKQYILNDEQMHKIAKYVIVHDLEEWETKYNELALSRIAIDSSDKKYVVAYQSICFSPEDKSLKLVGNLKINSSFLIEGQKHSLFTYTELSAEEFRIVLNENFSEAVELLRDGLSHKEKINTRPEFFCLQRNIQANLGALFSKIEAKWDEGTLPAPLKAFFGNSSLRNNGSVKPKIVLFDDRVNADQALLIYSTLKNKITYVQGPPGTGKSQTIFNTILSAYFGNKNVLVCTNNNKPLDSIAERMTFKYRGEDIPFPFLRLGNKDFMKLAVEKIRNFLSLKIDSTMTLTELDEMRKNVLGKNEKSVDALTNYQKRKICMDNIAFLDKTLKLGANLKAIEKEKEKLNKQLESLPLMSEKELISMFVSLKNDAEAMEYIYQSSMLRIKRLQSPKYAKLREIVMAEDEEERVKKFSSYIYDNSNIESLTEVFPIIFSTNLSSKNIGNGDFLFDLVIMDEAGQADIATSLIPISRAHSLLLVGDEDQLLPVIGIDPSVNDFLKKEYDISDTYDYLNNSILSTMKAADNVTNRIMLRTHYRCGRKIINYSNIYFYQYRLKLPQSLKEGSLEYYSCPNKVQTKIRNQNFQEAMNVVTYCKKNGIRDCAIITPFVNQATLINILLEKNGLNDIKASTIHSVQGSEKNTIIISLGVSKYTSKPTVNWLNNHAEIANVAASRAKSKLVVFGDGESLSRMSTGDSAWKELIEYCKKDGTSYKISPIYDKAKIGLSNGSLTEDEFYETISQIVSTRKRMKLVRNVMLKDVLGEEYSSSKQEFDSVLYVKQGIFGTFKPLYAFEFDGGEHYSDSRRIAQDKKKQEVCEKEGLKLIRLPNFYSKDYEFLKILIEDYARDKNVDGEQLSLF